MVARVESCVESTPAAVGRLQTALSLDEEGYDGSGALRRRRRERSWLWVRGDPTTVKTRART